MAESGGIIDSLTVAVRYVVDKASEARAKHSLDDVAAGALAAAAAVAALTVAVAENTAEQGYQAEALGLTVDEYTRLAFVAEAARVPVENLQGGLRQLTQQLGQAAMGQAGPAELFARLGVAVRDANGEVRKASDVLADIGEHMDDVRLKGTGASIALQLLGDDGARLRPLLGLGGDAIRDLTSRADFLGATIDEEAVEAARRLTGSISELRVLSGGMARRLTADVVPALADVTEGTIDWYLANKDLIDARVDLVAGALGGAFESATTPLGAVVTGTAAIIGGKKGWETLVKAAGGYGPALQSVGAKGAKLVGKAGILALIALGVEDIYAATTKGEGAIVDFFDALGYGAEARDIFMAFGEAMSANLDLVGASAAYAVAELTKLIDLIPDLPDLPSIDFAATGLPRLPSADDVSAFFRDSAAGNRALAESIRTGSPINVTVQAPPDVDAIAREAGKQVEREVRGALRSAEDLQ